MTNQAQTKANRAASALLVAGAIQSSLAGLFDKDVVNEIFNVRSGAVMKILYALFGIAGIYRASAAALAMARRRPQAEPPRGESER